MKELFKYILLFVFINNLLFSEDVIIDKIDDSNYPEIKVDAFFTKDDVLIKPDKSQLQLFENYLKINEFALNCADISNSSKKSYILSVDISKSIEFIGLDFLKVILKDFVNSVFKINSENEILIQLFSNRAYVLQDFTSDKNILLNSIDRIELFGYTDFNEAFFKSNSSSLNLAEFANYDVSIITISDAKSVVSENEVISTANSKSITIFPIILNTEINESFIRIANSTSGSFLFSQDLIEISKFFKKVIFLSGNNKPCEIIFNSNNCRFSKRIEIEFENDRDYSSLYVEPELFTYIDYPNDNFVQFTDGEETLQIQIKAINNDIVIDSISYISNHFRLLNDIKDYYLPENSILTLDIQYFNETEDYINSEFTIHSDICFGKSFWASNGSSNTIEGQNLKIQFPNGGEKFQAKNDTLIKWSGVSPADTVILELSTNNGDSWSKVRTQTYAGLEGKIIFPDITSYDCLIRIKQLSQSNMDEDIHIFAEHKNDILGLKHTNDGRFLYSADIEGNIIKWDLENFSFDSYVLNNISGLNDFDINANGSQIAYASSEPSIQFFGLENNEVDFVLNSTESIIKKFKWNKSNSFVAGFSNNKLLIWQIPNSNPLKIIEFPSENVTDLSFSDDKLIVSTFESNIHIIDLIILEIEESINVSNKAINSIDFNLSGKNLVAGLNDEDILVLNPFTQTNLKTFTDRNNITNIVEWSAVNSLIASVNNRNQIKLWSLSEAKEVFSYDYHDDIITAMDWSPENDYIASAEGNGEIHYWNTNQIPFENEPLQIDTSDNTFSILKPKMSIKNVSFLPVNLGDFRDTLVTELIKNTGEIDIIIDSIGISGKNAGSFSIKTSFPKILKTDSIINSVFLFTPLQVSENRADLIIYSGLEIFRSSLVGFANKKLIEEVITDINFGKVNLFEINDTTLNIFRNISGANFVIDSLELLNGNEQFQILNFQTSLNNEDYFNVKLSYRPDNLSLTGDILKIFYNSGQVYYVSLSGQGVAPEISFPEKVDFGTLKCDTFLADSLFEIINSGTNFYRIDSVLITGSEAFILKFDDDKIDANKSSDLLMSFSPERKGNHSALITIYSNFKNDFSNTTEFEVFGFLDSIDIRIVQNEIFIDNLNKNQEFYDTLTVLNFGTDTVEIENINNLNYFSVENYDYFLPPNDSVKLFVKFNGASEDGRYSDIIRFFDYCNSLYEINLTAIVGESEAQISTAAEINLGETRCGNSKSITFDISNTGLTNLIIYNMNFKNDYFQITENVKNLTIGSGQLMNFTISADNLQKGENIDTLLIFSNAENAISGVTQIPVRIINNHTNLIFSSDTVSFPKALENIEYESNLIVTNTGTIPFVFDESYSTDYFTIDNIQTLKIGENENSNLLIRFKGGLSGQKYSGMFDFQDSCGNIYKIFLLADVIGYAQAGLKTGDFTAAIGDTFSLPVYLYSPENIELPDVDSYTTTLRFNSALMYPINETPSGEIINRKRYIEISGIPAKTQGEEPVKTLDFLVTLGDTNYTDIELINPFSPDNESITIESALGSLTVSGICESGGERFILYTGEIELLQNAPNPAGENTKIKFSLIEKGFYSLDLYDIKGNYILNIDDGYIESAQIIEVELDLSELATGNYLYRLRTPSHVIIKKLTVKR
jgi:hypothetical protein